MRLNLKKNIVQHHLASMYLNDSNARLVSVVNVECRISFNFKCVANIHGCNKCSRTCLIIASKRNKCLRKDMTILINKVSRLVGVGCYVHRHLINAVVFTRKYSGVLNRRYILYAICCFDALILYSLTLLIISCFKPCKQNH